MKPIQRILQKFSICAFVVTGIVAIVVPLLAQAPAGGNTEQLHTIERWTRINMGTLVNAVTIDDPGAYSRPFTVTFNARLAPPGDELMENFCQENNQFGVAGGHAHPFARP